MPPIKSTCFALYTGDAVPMPPDAHRICPTCLNAMHVTYCWKSSERVIRYFCTCHCGSRSKARILVYRLDKKGRLTK